MKKAPEMLSQNNSKSTTMKQRITQAFMVIMFMTIVLTAQARDNEREISLTTVKQKAVVLKLDNVNEGTSIRLLNEKGQVLFSDETKFGKYGKVFNLEKLERGKLVLEVEDQETVQLLPITVTEQSASMELENQTTYIKPIVRVQNGEMKVFLRAGHQPFVMRMLDNFNDIVYRQTVKDTLGGMKRYDVSKLPSGKYNIQFTADGRSFYHTITLN